jgi:hypothetical protein
MNAIYQKLITKPDHLHLHDNINTQLTKNTTSPRVINLSNTSFHTEPNTINLGIDFALEQSTHKNLDNLIVEAENAVRLLDPLLQNLYRHVETTRIKRIAQTNYTRINTIHKRHQYILSGIRKKIGTE